MVFLKVFYNYDIENNSIFNNDTKTKQTVHFCKLRIISLLNNNSMISALLLTDNSMHFTKSIS